MPWLLHGRKRCRCIAATTVTAMPSTICATAGVSTRLYEEFLKPLLLVALFAPPEELSAGCVLGSFYFYSLFRSTPPNWLDMHVMDMHVICMAVSVWMARHVRASKYFNRQPFLLALHQCYQLCQVIIMRGLHVRHSKSEPSSVQRWRISRILMCAGAAAALQRRSSSR
jgi:hypothetical protein